MISILAAAAVSCGWNPVDAVILAVIAGAAGTIIHSFVRHRKQHAAGCYGCPHCGRCARSYGSCGADVRRTAHADRAEGSDRFTLGDTDIRHKVYADRAKNSENR